MPLRSRIGENSSTDSNSRSPLSDETTWPKRGGRTTSHFGDGVSFHRAHTHWCVSLGGKADILEAKLSLASWKPSRSGRVGVFGRSDTHAWRKHRGNEFFIRTSEMRSGPPCALRHWQRLQPASRWRLGSYSFSADRLPTFIVCPHQDPPISPPSLQVSLGCRDDLTQTLRALFCCVFRSDPAVDAGLSEVAAAITDVELRPCLRTTFFFCKTSSTHGYDRTVRPTRAPLCSNEPSAFWL